MNSVRVTLKGYLGVYRIIASIHCSTWDLGIAIVVQDLGMYMMIEYSDPQGNMSPTITGFRVQGY